MYICMLSANHYEMGSERRRACGDPARDASGFKDNIAAVKLVRFSMPSLDELPKDERRSSCPEMMLQSPLELRPE